MQKFTPNDLLLYVLNEVDDHTRASIDNLLLTNDLAKKEVENLRISLQEIDSFQLEPNPKSMDIVLDELQVERNLHIH
jgi:hypothetical protein